MTDEDFRLGTNYARGLFRGARLHARAHRRRGRTPRHADDFDAVGVLVEHWRRQRGKTGTTLLATYMQHAEREIVYWNALHLLAAERLRNNLPLGNSFRRWIADVLDEKRIPPRNPGRPRSATFGRDLNIVIAIMVLRDVYGMKPTRNDASAPVSACDAVAAALADEVHLSYKTVASIWQRREKLSP